MIRVISTGSQIFATDLVWQRIIGTGRAVSAAMQQASQIPLELGQFRHIIIRKEARQYAISRYPEHKTGMASAASVIADAIGDNFAGIFEVDEGWYFLVARRGDIHPSSDRLFERKDENGVRQALEKALQDDLINAVYAPDIFQIARARELRIEPVLERERHGLGRFLKRNRLQQLGRSKRLKTCLPVIILLLLLVFAVNGNRISGYVHAWFVPQVPVKVTQIIEPWEQQSAAGPFLESCVQTILAHPELPGATMKNAECGAQQVVYSYFPYGKIALTLIANDSHIPHGCNMTFGRAELLLTCQKNMPGKVGRIDLLDEVTANKRLWKLFGSLGAILNIGAISVLPAQFFTDSQPVKRTNGKTIPISMKMDFPPDILSDMAGSIPALIISTVKFISPSVWMFDGVVYVQ